MPVGPCVRRRATHHGMHVLQSARKGQSMVQVQEGPLAPYRAACSSRAASASLAVKVSALGQGCSMSL